MTFLPIVDRELREGSRRRGTYWLRVRVAFQALLIGLVAYFINLLQPQIKLGTVLFWGLSGVSMLFCLLAGRRSTADCLSQEKRAGTLGLLFLTDLKGYDVVLGKLVATSISGFYALVSVFPVLAIPLLAGGMTNGELWRMVLVLVNTFFFSLALGIFASAISREYRAAMAANFLLALFIAGAPAACGIAYEVSRNLFMPQLFYSCPIFSFFLCSDNNYTTMAMARDFWWSLGVTHALAWLLILWACRIVPRTWGDKPPAPSRRWRWRNLGRMISYGSPARCAAFRKQALDVNAFYWLAARARIKPVQVWFFLGCAVVWWMLGWLKSGNYWTADATFFTTAFIVNSALKLWITLEAGQRLVEDRRAGAFELLLATPLTVDDFLCGQILALRRQFLRPLLLVTALELVLMWAFKRHGTAFNTHDVWTCLAGVAMLWADVLALPWVAMAAALTSKTQTQATSFTVARIFILPWVTFGCLMFGLNLLDDLDLMHWHPSDGFVLGSWFGIGVAADLLFGLRAWHLLRKNFRRLAVQTFLPEALHSSWWRTCWNAVKWTGGWVERLVPARARKPALACLAVGAALMAMLFLRHSQPHFPPPVLVSITHSNAPFNVFPGGENGVFFILPDGTLWRWGRPGAPESPRAGAPEQIGTAHDWVKVVGASTHCLGLRADGSIWGWGFSNGRYAPEPQPAIAGNDWIDLGIGAHHASAVKRDGTIWTWNEPLVVNAGKADAKRAFFVPDGPIEGHGTWGYVNRPGRPPIAHRASPFPSNPPTGMKYLSSSNWVSVYCGNESTFALQKNGTIWAEGNLRQFVGGSWQILHMDAIQVCAETNWTSLDANGLARNQVGELWDIRNASPNPQASASAVCAQVSLDWASDRVHSASPWMLAQIRANGSLWTVPRDPGSVLVPSAENWRQLGTRLDWVAVWGQTGTGFGMTADGTVWTWGMELGQEPVKNYESRLQLLRDRLTGGASHTSIRYSPLFSAQPRPLLKLVEGKAPPPTK